MYSKIRKERPLCSQNKVTDEDLGFIPPYRQFEKDWIKNKKKIQKLIQTEENTFK
jgi:hypothetical protein